MQTSVNVHAVKSVTLTPHAFGSFVTTKIQAVIEDGTMFEVTFFAPNFEALVMKQGALVDGRDKLPEIVVPTLLIHEVKNEETKSV